MRPPVRLALALSFLLAAAPARALEPGSILLGVGVTSGTADFVARDGAFLSAFEHGEVGLALEGWYFLDDDMALTASGGIGRFREKETAGVDEERIYTQRSWHARVGIDQVIDFAHEALLYFGPGVEWWSGHARFANFPGTEPIAPTVNRWSVSARFGGVIVLGDSYGLNGHIGYRVGYASAEDGDARTTWLPNGYEAAAGLVYSF